ncbi:hypothetical protein H310_06929 [Aphanomyces invadans]|uniref:Uncharacterized protein n=1 Tax=Aphanomyces invadans TaxID=157072 RepID=A0A024U565_9STRA|nr:hypothetical protein H310_06929 [Aphanomyces invadans]ETW01379.1 hypothetical protein H310_06929 [Aphanomyces invadans]|eukprot:XP_008870377.1 hypothetical protein H310_06929 [Aphanomyces invadans]
MPTTKTLERIPIPGRPPRQSHHGAMSHMDFIPLPTTNVLDTKSEEEHPYRLRHNTRALTPDRVVASHMLGSIGLGEGRQARVAHGVETVSARATGRRLSDHGLLVAFVVGETTAVAWTVVSGVTGCVVTREFATAFAGRKPSELLHELSI